MNRAAAERATSPSMSLALCLADSGQRWCSTATSILYMKNFRAIFNQLDGILTTWMARYGIAFLRISLGLVFFWFGFLKFFPGLSPAQDLAARTINQLSFGVISSEAAVIILAVWECLIGLGLIFRVFMRATLLLLFLQMLGTFAPLFLFPREAFTHFPYAPTLEGQYIIKNIVLISAGLVIGSTVRGGAVVATPELVQDSPPEKKVHI